MPKNQSIYEWLIYFRQIIIKYITYSYTLRAENQSTEGL